MKLSWLKVLIVLNILIVMTSLGVIYFRYSELSRTSQSLSISSIDKEESLVTHQTNSQSDLKESTFSVLSNESSFVSLPKIRRPKFVYFSSKAKKVALIGDFNDWIPTPMKKVSSSKWELTLEIPEGRYLYNFLVDGKIVLDPNNKLSEISKEGFKSSVLDLR